MIKTLAALMLLAASLPLCAQETNSVQSWTSSDGKIIQAKFVRMEADAVVIERDGKPFIIPFAKLAPASVELAKRLQGNTGGEAAATTDAAIKIDAATITNKLHQIIVPKIDFSNTPVKEAIDFLHQRSVELDALETDPKRKGVDFVFSKTTAPEKIDALRISELHIRNAPLHVALKYVCDQTKLRFTIKDSQVVLVPQEEYTTVIHIRTFTLPPDFTVWLEANYGGGGEGTHKPVIQLLKNAGISFPDGTSATLSNNILTASNTEMELDKIEMIVNATATIIATDPAIQFRWLQTDPKTADAIVDVIKANNLSADAFSAKIDPQVKGGKIKEVAAFDRKIISGERFVLKPADDKIPLVMEAEATVSQDGRLVDLRYVSEWTPKTAKGSGLLRINTATMLSSQRWYLLARWGDAKTDTLLLACGGSNPAKPKSATSAAPQPPVVVHLDAEWRETSAADLAKVVETPPENRAKALVWLRGRSTLLANATGTCKIGQKSSHEHLWGGKSDAELEEELNKHPNKDFKEPPPRPGVTFVWETSIAAADNELNLRLDATYVPLKALGKLQGTKFLFNGKLLLGVPEFVASKEAPQQDLPVVVLVLTPWYDIIR